MPHTVRKGKGSKPWKIANKDTGETKGSSKTKQNAKASARITKVDALAGALAILVRHQLDDEEQDLEDALREWNSKSRADRTSSEARKSD